MLKVLSLVLSFLAVFGIAVIIAGYISSPKYKDSLQFSSNASAGMTWAALVDIERIPELKRDVQSVEIIDQYGRLIAWKENLRRNEGYRIYRMNERVEGKKLVLELTESSYGLTGVWTFFIEDRPQDPRVYITEESTLTDIRIRGWRYFFGRDHDLLAWSKFIRVGVTERLITTP